MKKLYPQSVSNILKNKKLVTHSVTEHALTLQQLNEILQKILPEPLAQHCQVANIHADTHANNKHNTDTPQQKNRHLREINSKTLILAASSPSWSSRLRFQVPEILKTLQQDYELPVKHIRILISQHLSGQHPSTNTGTDTSHLQPLEKTSLPETEPSKILLSEENANLVRETAHSIENPDLRDSLIRLSRHSRKN